MMGWLDCSDVSDFLDLLDVWFWGDHVGAPYGWCGVMTALRAGVLLSQFKP